MSNVNVESKEVIPNRIAINAVHQKLPENQEAQRPQHQHLEYAKNVKNANWQDEVKIYDGYEKNCTDFS